MEKRIELEKRGRRPNQIIDLNLDNCRSTSIVGLSDEFTSLESLSLINIGLTTLKGFPKLPNLKKLELSDNRISNGLNYLETSQNLTHLNLSGNKLKDLETLKPLENFKKLEVLDLFNNEVQSIEKYREKIFELLPSLKYLDGFDANDVEVPESEDDEVNGNETDDDGEDDSDECGEDEEDGDEDDDDDDDESDVSLAQVYNDDLEEDNSDWNDDVEGEDDDDEESEGEGDDGDDGEQPPKAGATATTVSAAAAPVEADKKDEDAAADDSTEESQARGKKRKHDG